MYIKSPNLTTEWQKVVGDSFDNLHALEMGYINGGQKVLLTVKENYPTMSLNYHNLDDGLSHEEYASLTGDGYTAKIVVANMDLDGQPDIIVAAGDTINIVSNRNPGQVDTVAPGCNSPVIDLAVADTTGDGTRDVFAVTQKFDIWQFNVDNDHLIPLAVTGVPTSLESLDDGARLAYGTAAGSIRILNDDEFESEIICRLKNTSVHKVLFQSVKIV